MVMAAWWVTLQKKRQYYSPTFCKLNLTHGSLPLELVLALKLFVQCLNVIPWINHIYLPSVSELFDILNRKKCIVVIWVK